MIATVFLLLMVAACAVALANWRLGLLAMVLVGILQDPVRKMTPGVPGFLVLSAGLVWGGCVLSAAFRRQIQWPQFQRHYRGLSAAIVVFTVLLVPAAIRSATYSPGSWQITLVGAFVYGSLLLGILMGTVYPRTGNDIRRLLGWYCILTALAMCGVLLEKQGYQHASIGTEAMGNIWVTYRMGSDPVRMLAGFFRSPDVQGWHAAMLVMLSLILAVHARQWMRGLWMLTAGLGGVGVMVCGRRKMIAMLPVFLLFYVLLHLRHGRIRHLAWVAVAVCVACATGLQAYRFAGVDELVTRFYGTAIDTARTDLQEHGIESVVDTYRQAGFLGYGLGMATQGTQHIRAKRPRVWQESGPSKLMAELGVLGFVGSIMLGFSLLLAMVRELHAVTTSSLYPVFAGLAAAVFANVTAGVVSAQIFGDPFVSACLSLLVGIVLSAARLQGAAPPEAGGGDCDETGRMQSVGRAEQT